MKIVIKEQEIELKYSFRALIIYENIMNKSFEGRGITEILTFMYCVILGSQKGLEFTYDEFLDLIDTQPNLIKEFSEWLTATVEQNNALMMKNVSDKDKKKLAKVKKSEKNF